MPGNSFGNIFRITTFGESHGPSIGVVIDGCPAELEIDEAYIQQELDRRKPGQSSITTQRKESDQLTIISGVFEGKTLGTPITLLIPNQDQRSEDYEHVKNTYRPSHADYTYAIKYGHRDYRGGGRASARETVARVAAGAIAKLILKQQHIYVQAYVKQVSTITLNKHYSEMDLSLTEQSIIRCPDPETAQQMIRLIEETRITGDTLGGVVQCIIKNCPAGLGEPVFDKLQADLAKAMLSINAVHGFEYGSGFYGSTKLGSENNDLISFNDKKITFSSNNSGGILGGISNGDDIYFNVAFKPVATIMKTQETINQDNKKVVLESKGRHDPCVLPRAVPIVEAMAALVIVDHLFKYKSTRL